jgi:transcriptional regulator with XRE-family HTH domain
MKVRGLAEDFRLELAQARHQHDWSQAEFGRLLGLPQTHISDIETGKTVPRFDTLLDLVRVLDHDLLLVPRTLVPTVQALLRDYRSREQEPGTEEGERPLYAADDEDDGG